MQVKCSAVWLYHVKQIKHMKTRTNQIQAIVKVIVDSGFSCDAEEDIETAEGVIEITEGCDTLEEAIEAHEMYGNDEEFVTKVWNILQS